MSSVVQLVERGLNFHQSGQLDLAEGLYRQALERSPRDAGILNLLGVVALNRGDAGAAVEWLRKAVALEGVNPQYRSNLAVALKAGGNLDASIEELRRTVKLVPGYQEAWYNLGNALEERKLLDEAVPAYRKAILLVPNDPSAHYGLGRAFHEKGLFGEARQCFDKVLSLHPGDAKAYRRLGMTYEAEGYMEQAEAAYRMAIDIQPRFVKAINSLGKLYMQVGEHGRATDMFFESIKINPEDSDAYYSLSASKQFTLEDLPLLDRIENIVGRTEVIDGAAVEIRYTLGKVYNDLGRYEKAFQNYAEANCMQGKFAHYDRNGVLEKTTQTIQTYSKECFDRNRFGHTSDQPILIVGMPRSGTTLMEQIISSHPLVHGAGELTFWPEEAARLSHYDEVYSNKDEVTKIADRYLGLLRNLSSDCLRVTDKLPDNYSHLGLIHLVFPKARIIHCRRNPVDTCLSIYFQNFTGGHEYRFNLEDLAFHYRQYRRLMAYWRSALPPEVLMEVDYEEVIQNQEEVSRRLVDFCGLEWDDRCLEFYRNERVVKTASQWQVRQPIYKTSQGRWRNYEPWIGPLLELLQEEKMNELT